MPEHKLPNTIYLKDYRPPDFLIESVDLYFDLHDEKTTVRSRMLVCRNPKAQSTGPLVLDGSDLLLKYISIDGRRLNENEYSLVEDNLIIENITENFELDIVTQINPKENSALTGLYMSNGIFCTQCEAQGFRKITYFLDRPDVLSRYKTTIIADKIKFPVLISNGNLIGSGERDKSRHWVRWQDPFPKPCYLFALVAGDLAHTESTFVTRSSKEVKTQIFTEEKNIEKCEHAMASLHNAMRWDEETYGREYDLDLYMIVAVDDFNAGAMENKGLNIFNTKYVLADPSTATDKDYQNIESVIAHEYFHNWSGNRVTCRDWFQLSLKEGFTVFRDQEFSANMGSKGVSRINTVDFLRTYQFKEDSGPTAHPVRPDSYVEINNFYTQTIYNKGAEIIRMIQTLVGREGFRRGTDLYFSKYDGMAVTTDDFIAAIEEAGGIDLGQFKLWYVQSGTPIIKVDRNFNPWTKSYTLHITQSCPATPNQAHKKPFHIPFVVSLLNRDGKQEKLKFDAESTSNDKSLVLQLQEETHVYNFVDIETEPFPSVLQGFSAPVKIDIDLSDEELCFLMAHDNDPFNRWEAGQKLSVNIILRLIKDYHRKKELVLDESYIDAFQKALKDYKMDKELIAYSVSLPSEIYISEFMKVIDPIALHEVWLFVKRTLARSCRSAFLALFETNVYSGSYKKDAKSIGQRSLKNVCLSYLMELDDGTEDNVFRRKCMDQFHNGNNMTDVFTAFVSLINSDCKERNDVIEYFYEKWKHESLVMDKWLAAQAMSRLPDTIDRVVKLTEHDVFNCKNPNKVRALIGSFRQFNHAKFHDISGKGYAFVADWITKLDPINPQVAANLAQGFTLLKNYNVPRQRLMTQQLERILGIEGLSKDVLEIVSKTLGHH